MSIAIRLFGDVVRYVSTWLADGLTHLPYCMYAGGNVVNVAIELNGQPPLQVYVKPSKEYKIILRSIDLGAMEVVSTWDELHDYKKIGSPFSIPKAALALAGFVPEFSAEHYPSLEDQLKNFGCGLEVTLLAAIPCRFRTWYQFYPYSNGSGCNF